MERLEWINSIGIIRSAIGAGAKYRDTPKYKNG